MSSGSRGGFWAEGESAMGRRRLLSGDEIAEERCFACKDGGEGLRVCDYKNCLKSYHQKCMKKRDGLPSSGEQFICDWHICVDCRNSSDYQCLCCPFYSVCRNCLGKVKFVIIGKQNKGLCENCFHLAISIEKNPADPWAPIGCEGSDCSGLLFKDYWTVIRDREHLTLVDLQEASGLLERGANRTHEEDSEKFPDEDLLDDSDDNEQTLPDKMKTSMKRKRPKRKTYVGWGTKELIEFLSCLGKDTQKTLDETAVVRIVKEYIGQKDLFLGDKKKYFECDDKLRPLFTRRKVKYNMLHSKLRMHLAENADSEDEDDNGSEDDNVLVMKKKLHSNLEPRIATSVSERNKRCFASLNQHNINLLYMRRSLVITLLSHPDTFEQKVVGCFVRVKHNARSYLLQKAAEPFHLGLVTGIKKSKEKYKVNDTYTDIFLCVAGFLDDVDISMLSDENIDEDEYKYLIPLVEKGLMKRATVEELEEKVAGVHTDIVNNCIDKELQRLEREIVRANEQGWREELRELWDRKKLLSSPAERQRRLAVVPKITADTVDEKEIEVRIAAGNSCLMNRETTQPVVDSIDVLKAKPAKGVAGYAAESFEVQKEKPPEGATQQALDAFNIPNEESSKGAADQIAESLRVLEVGSREAGEALSRGLTSDSVLHSPVYKAQDGSNTKAIDTGKEESNHSKNNKGGNIPVCDVIDLDPSDDDEDLNAPECETLHPPKAINGSDLHMEQPKSASHAQQAINGTHLGHLEPAPATVNEMAPHTSLWHYVDPNGDSQGPFPLIKLQEWKKDGFFDEGFKVWRAEQTKEHAILLTDALRMNL